MILFVSDGAGPEHFELGKGANGGSLSIDSIPWKAQGTLDTASLDGVTDSAAAATALATGVETHNGWLSMVPSGSGATPVPTALEAAMADGKWAGLVTDVYVTDATPAAFGSHVTDRGLYEEIATQLAAPPPADADGRQRLRRHGAAQGPGRRHLRDQAQDPAVVPLRRQAVGRAACTASGPAAR